MVNYSVDASVYACTLNNVSDAEEIKKHYEIIKKLYDLIITKHPLYRKFFLFEEDMKLVRKFYLKSYTPQNIPILEQIIKTGGYNRNNIRWMMHLTDKITTRNENKKNEYIMFEKWFNIEDIKFKEEKYPPLPEEINEKISDADLLRNTQKNIAKIAFLNQYVYKSDKLHNIILGDSIETESIPPMDKAEFDIIMTDNYIIKNAPSKVVNSLKQNVNISKLDALVTNDFKYKSNEWKEALNDAEENFKEHLKFGPDVKPGLEKYVKEIKNESNKLSEKNKKIFSDWMEEGPNTLYEYLKALDDFLANSNLKPVKKITDLRYQCCKKMCDGKICPESRSKGFVCQGKCEFLEACGSNIRYFGVDCVDELNTHKKDKDVEKARTKKNCEGGESAYFIHLRPQKMEFEASLGFLSLRIHFRPLDTGKIEIGWIGKHLYLPHIC